MTQAKPKPTMLEWIISGAVLGGFAGAILMFSAHEYREAVWGYTGLALLTLGVLIAVTGLFIIAANAIRFPQDNAPQQAAQHLLEQGSRKPHGPGDSQGRNMPTR